MLSQCKTTKDLMLTIDKCGEKIRDAVIVSPEMLTLFLTNLFGWRLYITVQWSVYLLYFIKQCCQGKSLNSFLKWSESKAIEVA